jgi:hypothetical protein
MKTQKWFKAYVAADCLIPGFDRGDDCVFCKTTEWETGETYWVRRSLAPEHKQAFSLTPAEAKLALVATRNVISNALVPAEDVDLADEEAQSTYGRYPRNRSGND